jgi:hypothetical protein
MRSSRSGRGHGAASRVDENRDQAKTYWHVSAVGDANAEHDIYDDHAICDYVSIRSTHRARHAGASNGSAKYCISRATLSPLNSMMLTV